MLAGLLDRGEEVADQCVGAPEFVRNELLRAPEAVPVIVGLRARQVVCVVKAQQPAPVVIMQREALLDSVGPQRADLDLGDAESDAPAIHEPVSPVVEVEQTAQRFIERGQAYHLTICIKIRDSELEVRIAVLSMLPLTLALTFPPCHVRMLLPGLALLLELTVTPLAPLSGPPAASGFLRPEHPERNSVPLPWPARRSAGRRTILQSSIRPVQTELQVLGLNPSTRSGPSLPIRPFSLRCA